MPYFLTKKIIIKKMFRIWITYNVKPLKTKKHFPFGKVMQCKTFYFVQNVIVICSINLLQEQR